MNEWDGKNRRNTETESKVFCNGHIDLIQRVTRVETQGIETNNKLDDITEQMRVMIISVAKIQSTLENGLRADIKQTRDQVSSLTERVNEFSLNKETANDLTIQVQTVCERVDKLEKVDWFAQWVTKSRDSLFLTLLKFGFISSVVLFIYLYGPNIKKFLGVN